MLTKGSAVGYRNLVWPQLYPKFSYWLGRRNELSGYIKYAPMISLQGALPLSNREVPAGLSLTRYSKGALNYTLNLDLSNMALATQVNSMSLSTVSLGFGIGF